MTFPGLLVDGHLLVGHVETAYWRDVGTLDAYWEANMDLVSVSPVFNLYDTEAAWKLVHDLGDQPASAIIKHEASTILRPPMRSV